MVFWDKWKGEDSILCDVTAGLNMVGHVLLSHLGDIMFMWSPGVKFIPQKLELINYSLEAWICFHCIRDRKI